MRIRLKSPWNTYRPGTVLEIGPGAAGELLARGVAEDLGPHPEATAGPDAPPPVTVPESKVLKAGPIRRRGGPPRKGGA